MKMLGRNGQDSAHAGDNAVHNQRGEHGVHVHGAPAQRKRLPEMAVQSQLEVSLQPISHRKG